MANTIYVNVSGTWKTVSDYYVNVGGTWKTGSEFIIKASGTWYGQTALGLPTRAQVLGFSHLSYAAPIHPVTVDTKSAVGSASFNVLSYAAPLLPNGFMYS